MCKVVIIFVSISLNMCFGCSKEPSHRDGCFKYPKHMFWLRNNKNNFQLRTLIWGPGPGPKVRHFFSFIIIGFYVGLSLLVIILLRKRGLQVCFTSIVFFNVRLDICVLCLFLVVSVICNNLWHFMILIAWTRLYEALLNLIMD